MAKGIQKNMRATFLSKIPISGFAFAHSVLITRLLGPEGFGVFQYISTNVQFLVMAIGFNMTNGVMYFTASKRISESKIASLVAVIFVLFYLLFTLGLLVLPTDAFFGKFILPPEYRNSIFAIYFLLAFAYHFVQVFMHAHLKGRKSFIRSNNLLMIAGGVSVAVSGSLFAWVRLGHSADLEFLFRALSGLQVILLIIIVLGYVRSVKPRWNLNWTREEMKVYFAYTSLGYGNMFSKFFNKRLDVYFVQYLSGSKALGLYGVATTLTNFLLEFVQPLNQVILPYLTTMDRDQTRSIYPVYLRIFSAMITLPVIILILFAEPIVMLIYGQQFLDAAAALRVISIAIVFAYIRNYFSSYNNAKDRVRFNLMANVTALIITVVLDILLIPNYGILGAAYATLAAYALSSIMVGFSVKNHLGISWGKLLLPRVSDLEVVRTFMKKKL